MVQTKRGSRICRTTCVKPLVKSRFHNGAIHRNDDGKERDEAIHDQGRAVRDIEEYLALEHYKSNGDFMPSGDRMFPVGIKKRSKNEKIYPSYEFAQMRKDEGEGLIMRELSRPSE